MTDGGFETVGRMKKRTNAMDGGCSILIWAAPTMIAVAGQHITQAQTKTPGLGGLTGLAMTASPLAEDLSKIAFPVLSHPFNESCLFLNIAYNTVVVQLRALTAM